MTINILTDSTSDLGSKLAQDFGIRVIPLIVTVGSRNYLDGLEINQEGLFHLVEKEGQLPKTSAPSVGEFQDFFSSHGDQVYIGISSKLSATIQNATLAAGDKLSDSIRVVDSLNLSTGIGLLALKAAELRDAGRTTSEIEEQILKTIPKVHTSFMIDTMEFLYKGGRCTALQAFAGSMLKIHPVIEIRADGTLGVKDKVRGTRQKGLFSLLEDFKSCLDRLDRHRVFITHTTSDEDAEFLKQEIIRIANPDSVLITKAGSVIASHCGPGTIGILFLEK